MVWCVNGGARVAVRPICASHQALRWPPYLARWESTGRGWPIETPLARRSAGGARPARQRASSRSAQGATGDFGRRRGGAVHGPPAAPRRPTATRAGESSCHGHFSRRAPWEGRLVARSARMGGGGPATRWSRAPPTSARGCRPRRSRIGPNPAKNWWACSSGRATNSPCPRTVPAPALNRVARAAKKPPLRTRIRVGSKLA